MKVRTILRGGTRVVLLVAGMMLSTVVLSAVGKALVPIFDPWDKAILAACNPDTHVPGLDQFIRAWTDYFNFIVSVATISWIVAFGLYKLVRGRRAIVTGLLAVNTIVFVVMAVMGKLWPNKTYVSVNVFFVLALLGVLGGATYLFYSMDRDTLRRFSLVLMMVFLSGYLTGHVATERVKKDVARPRPLNDANKPWNEQVRIVPDEILRGRNSFPSGHTSGTFAIITPLFWYTRNRKMRAGLIGCGVLQGFSRVYTAAHFPFCCLMGGVLGFVNGTMVFFALGGPSLRPPLRSPSADPAAAAAMPYEGERAPAV